MGRRLLKMLLSTHQRKIAKFALRNRLPAMYTVRAFVDAGGLMAYGTNFSERRPVTRPVSTQKNRLRHGKVPVLGGLKISDISAPRASHRRRKSASPCEFGFVRL